MMDTEIRVVLAAVHRGKQGLHNWPDTITAETEELRCITLLPLERRKPPESGKQGTFEDWKHGPFGFYLQDARPRGPSVFKYRLRSFMDKTAEVGGELLTVERAVELWPALKTARFSEEAQEQKAAQQTLVAGRGRWLDAELALLASDVKEDWNRAAIIRQLLISKFEAMGLSGEQTEEKGWTFRKLRTDLQAVFVPFEELEAARYASQLLC